MLKANLLDLDSLKRDLSLRGYDNKEIERLIRNSRTAGTEALLYLTPSQSG